MLTTDQLDALEAAARGATPGPWHVLTYYDDAPPYAIASANVAVLAKHAGSEPRTHGYGVGDEPGFVCDLNDGEYHEYRDVVEQTANATFIAACDPATILALVAMARGQAAGDDA